MGPDYLSGADAQASPSPFGDGDDPRGDGFDVSVVGRDPMDVGRCGRIEFASGNLAASYVVSETDPISRPWSRLAATSSLPQSRTPVTRPISPKAPLSLSISKTLTVLL